MSDYSSNLLPKVVLAGRINVGKSTLLNRLIERKAALVSPTPATTRDRREHYCEWRGWPFVLVDTGGVEKPESRTAKRRNKISPETLPSADLTKLITKQTETAINEASLIILVTDANDGLLPQDQRWAEALRKSGRPTIVAVNKVDNIRKESAVAEFYRLGLGTPHPVSAANGRGTGDLLDLIVLALKKITPKSSPKKKAGPEPITMAIIGQPNSGKSTLLNAIIGEERMITSAVPNTTREPQDISFSFNGQDLVIIDTAGIRRRTRVSAEIEHQGVSASLKTISRADVVILLIDARRGPTTQDQRLARHVIDHGKGLILAINKWDLIKDKTAETMRLAERQLRQLLPGLDWVPIIFISAKMKKRIKETLGLALAAKTSAQLSLTEETLTIFLKTVVKKHRPTKRGGVRHPKVLSLKQVHADPPLFEIAVLGELHPSYLRFLENRLREHFGFTGVPITITLKTRRKRTK